MSTASHSMELESVQELLEMNQKLIGALMSTLRAGGVETGSRRGTGDVTSADEPAASNASVIEMNGETGAQKPLKAERGAVLANPFMTVNAVRKYLNVTRSVVDRLPFPILPVINMAKKGTRRCK